MRTQPSSTAGFTLVELVLTVVIVGILAAVVAPRFFDRQTYDVRAFLDQTRSMLRYAQKEAVAQNRPVYVGLANNRVALCFTSPCAASTTPLTDLVLAPAGNNSGSNPTTAACLAGTGTYNSSWYCESPPSGVAFSTAPVTSSFYFDAQGQPFAFTDTTTTTISTFTTTLNILMTGDGINHVLSVERDTGYVH